MARSSVLPVLLIVGVALAGAAQRGDGEGDGDAPPGSDGAGPGRCTVEVTADVLNVRAGPGLDEPVVDQVPVGTALEVDAQVVERFRRSEDGRWVSADYLAGPCG